ncbi:MAG: hypothetical protein LIP01_08470 [Tannerellaceae bacterium]|nr:hypothetical protein [Tannerellaceae bacterium]
MEHITRLGNTPEESTIHIMKLRGRIILTDGNLFYTYEDLTGEIVPYPGGPEYQISGFGR